MTKPIQALPTEFKGVTYRSRLEARWAIFMNDLGIEYCYELEGFDLGDAGWYLPDFYLPKWDYWLEIKKPGRVSEDAQTKCKALAQHVNRPVFLFQECKLPVVEKDFDGVPVFKYFGYHWMPNGLSDGKIAFGSCVNCDCTNCKPAPRLGYFGTSNLGDKPIDTPLVNTCCGWARGNVNTWHYPVLIAFDAACGARLNNKTGELTPGKFRLSILDDDGSRAKADALWWAAEQKWLAAEQKKIFRSGTLN